MADFLYLIHNNADNPRNPQPPSDPAAWDRFFAILHKGGHFRGGSALGEGCSRKGPATAREFTAQIGGYMLIQAESLEQATALLDECPVIQGGGVVEVRSLVRS